MQGDQQVGARPGRRPGRGSAPSRPAPGSAASAPPCASCRCWPRPRPARRCRPAARARSVQPSKHDGTRRRRSCRLTRVASPATRSPPRCATAGRRRCATPSTSDDWSVPQRAGLNPIAWELGHLAWFAEFWILRGPHALGAAGFVDAARPPRIAGPDAIFDSARLAHADRWTAPLPRPRRAGRDARGAARRLPRRAAARRRRRRRALLPPARAVPRRHARRGLRLVAGDAGPAGPRRPRSDAGPARRPAAADRRRRARRRPRADGAGLLVRQRAARPSGAARRRSRSTPRR